MIHAEKGANDPVVEACLLTRNVDGRSDEDRFMYDVSCQVSAIFDFNWNYWYL